MYPMTATETERISQQLEQVKPDKKLIMELIKNNDTTHMEQGVRYYDNQNDILLREKYATIDGVRMIDDTKPNNRIPHGWHKLLVDQKTSYMVGNPINFSTEDEDLLEHINYYFGEKFDNISNELIKNASNKGVEWLHPFIDEEGEFDYIITPAEQCIPIYQDKKQTKLQHMIRHYPIVIGTKKSRQVELWSEGDVTYYILEDNTLLLDTTEANNPSAHFYYVHNQEEKGFGWDRVPFIEFKNNEEERSDLHYYKQLLDSYDFEVSDVQNSFEEIQELIYVLKGYEGQSLSEFMQNLKYYKAINVDGKDGGVDTLQAEIPMDSINSHLDRLVESIYRFGGGVNTSTDDLGNAVSGIALKHLYSLLDLKSDTAERRFRTSLQDLVWFLCEYLDMQGDSHEKHDYKSVGFVFNRSVLSNDKENAEIARDSMGIISNRTIRANHPWTNNVEEEEKQVALEREEQDNMYDLDNVNTDTEDE